jgi:hypothetical protein
MIARALSFEVAGLRRSWAVPVTALFAVGGAVFGRTVTWLASLLQASEIEPFGLLGVSGTDIGIPLVMLGFVMAAAYVFGSDLAAGTADVVLTAPVKREAVLAAKLVVMLAWTLGLALVAAAADTVLRLALSVSAWDPGQPVTVAAVLGSALAGYATLPLIGWVALRFRGVVAATGAGIAVFAGAYLLRGYEFGAIVPWNAPYELVAHGADVGIAAESAVLFVAGVAACAWQMRRLDLV